MPKKVRMGALRAALRQKLQDGVVTVVDEARRRRRQDQGAAAMLRASASPARRWCWT
jgi:ribosomal protein L4